MLEHLDARNPGLFGLVSEFEWSNRRTRVVSACFLSQLGRRHDELRCRKLKDAIADKEYLIASSFPWVYLLVIVASRIVIEVMVFRLKSTSTE